MNSLDMELSDLKAKRPIARQREHPLRQYFLDRQITQLQISKHTGLSEPIISQAMRGRINLEDHEEILLTTLKERIDLWESEKGRLWNSPDPEKAIGAVPDIYEK